jgi:hypothetical protein
VLQRETVDIFTANWKAIGAELGFSAFVDMAFQVGQDWGNPYLTSGQKAERAGLAGAGGLASGGAGLVVEGVLIYYGVAAGPAGWAGIGVVLIADYLWSFWITPMIYDARGLNEERRLQPLGGSP